MALPASWATGSAITQANLSHATRTRSNSAFIRELWSDEIIAAYKANLVMAALVVVMNHNKKKGDTVHVPRPTRGVAVAKGVEAQVTLNVTANSSSQYLIDQHYEYSRLFEDIAMIQGDDSIRQFITDDAGFALSTQVDSFLWTQAAFLAGADAAPTVEAGTAYAKAVVGTPALSALVPWDPSAALSEGNASTITDEGMRLFTQHEDDNNTPSMGRVLVVPPVEVRKMLGIDRQIVFDSVGEAGRQNAIRNGFVGPLYGAEVFKSTASPVVQDDGLNGNERAAVYFQKEAILLIEQLAPRSQEQYKQEYLSDLFTADTIYGGGILRPEAGISIVVPSA
jgi:hypothetical protein